MDTGAACSALTRPAGPLSICGRPRDGSWWTAQGRAIYISPRLPRWHSPKESACKAGDTRSIPGLGRCPGERKGCSLQHAGLENSTDCMVCGVAKSRTRLSYFPFQLFQDDPLEKEMTTHSSILAGESHGWRSLAGCSPQGHKESATAEHIGTKWNGKFSLSFTGPE